uniref:Uncharacterized protein n=1 Tax=Oryzias melastigma TaxID=30732 RepID=A0A3B3CV78_ORYME
SPCGQKGPHNQVIFDFKAIVLHSTMRVLPMLEQLGKGLQLYNLVQVMETNPELCQPMFVPGNVHCVIIDKSFVKYDREVHIINFFQDFLQEVEDCGIESDGSQKLSVAKVMQRMTGQGHKPFLHGCGEDHTTCYPTVSACSRTVTFPVAHLTTYSEFKNIMETAICPDKAFIGFKLVSNILPKLLSSCSALKRALHAVGRY